MKASPNEPTDEGASHSDAGVDVTRRDSHGGTAHTPGARDGQDPGEGASPGPSSRVGRHVLIEQVGSGGMGKVYAAYDPKLDRKLAIKLLHGRGRSERDSIRLLREAKAMAQVSHPNVISVFDVGTQDGDVFIAMEFVDGGTLRSWIRDREQPWPWREVRRRFMDAGKGLLAAHDAGLVHGDFKPDNVLVSADGQVRVTDFGLARRGRASVSSDEPTAEVIGDAALTYMTRGVYGTPAYMAPEQFRHDPPHQLSDQFSYCVAMYEALYGVRPFEGDTAAAIAENVLGGKLQRPPRTSDVPTWLGDVVMRGLSVDPERRWPSMRELLAALHTDPTRRRWLIVGGAMVGVLVVGAGSAAWTHHTLLLRSCEKRASEIRDQWGDAQAAELGASLERSGAPNAAVIHEKAVPWLDAYADAWAVARRDVCLAGRVEESIPGADYEAARACLDDLRASFETHLEVLGDADRATAQRAVQLAADLPPVERCELSDGLRSRPRPPSDDASQERVHQIRRQLAGAAAHLVAGNYERGVALAEDGLAQATDLGWGPLEAEASLVLGRLRGKQGDYDEARRLLRSAAMIAGETLHDSVAAEATGQLVYMTGYELAKPELGEIWAAWADVYIKRLGEPEGVHAAARHNSIGAMYAASGRFEDAIAEFKTALKIREELFGPEHPDVATTLSNLAGMLQAHGDLDDALATFERALQIEEALVGEMHPMVADVHEGIGNTLVLRGDGKQALVSHERALKIRSETLGPEHPDTADTLLNAANAFELIGRMDTALEYTERAVALHEKTLGPNHPTVAVSLASLGAIYYNLDRHDDAAAVLTRALEIQREHLGDSHPDLVVTLNNLANIERVRKRLDAAEARYQETIAIAEKAYGKEHPMVAFPLTGHGEALLDDGRPGDAVPLLERAFSIRSSPDVPEAKRALTGFHLARALWDANLDRTRARKLAEEAVAIFSKESERDAEYIARVEGWLAERSDSATSR